MAHTTKIAATNSETGRISSDTPATVSSNSLMGKMLATKKHLKAYLKGEISLAELEAKGIELV